MREYCAQAGRADLPDVVLGSIVAPGEKCTAPMLLDRIGRYRELGVTAAGISIDGETRGAWCDNAERLGADVIAKI
jgi:hypothetical protein